MNLPFHEREFEECLGVSRCSKGLDEFCDVSDTLNSKQMFEAKTTA